VSPRGDALVLLGEARGERERIVGLRRPSGGSFAAEPLTEPGMAGLFDVAAGAGPGGELIAAWIEPSGVGTAVAPAGAPFGAAQRLGGDGDGLALAVAPDGRALVAWASAHDVLVSDRAPGGDRFGAPEAIPAPREFVDDIALAAGDGGRALVAWENGELDGKGPRVATRAPGGTFGAARTLTQPRIAGPGLGVSTLVERDGPLRPYDAQAPWFLRAAPAGDDFVLAWASDAYQELQAVTLAARVTDGGAEVAAVGASLRDNAGAVPLALPDGTAAVAWADQTFSADDKREQHARIHLALAGRPSGADPAPPEIAVSPRRQRVYRGDPIRFAVNCRAACDLLATIPISGEDAIGAHATAVAAGRAEIRSFIPRHARSPVHVTLRVSAPGGRRVAVHRVAVPVSFKPSVPVPRLLDVHAERDGDDLVVTWRTSFPARRVRFAVAAGETLVGVPGAGRRRFRARIRGEGGQKQFVIASTAPGRDVTTRTFKVR
jgi:hypothetical protein